MTLRKRFRGVIWRLGETMEVGGTATTGILTLLGAEGARTLLSDAELAVATPPFYMAYVPFDAEATVGDTATTPDGDFNVVRALDLRHRQETFARLLVLAPG